MRNPARALLIAMVLAAGGVTALQLSQAEEQTPTPTTPPASTVFAKDEAPQQIIVKYKAGIGEVETESVAEAVGANEKVAIPQLRMKVLRVPKQQRAAILEKLKADPRIEYAEPDAVWHGMYTTPNDPLYSKQIAWPITGTDLMWDKQKGGNITVATVDTGVANHPELSGKIAPGGFDLVNNDNDPTDDNGHGTVVAGIIAANTNNSVGVAGGCWNCKIIPFKALDAANQITVSNAANGVIRAADSGAKIINMSFGGTSSVAAVEDAVNYAAGKGALLIASAGNTGTESVNYPSAYPDVVSVAATDLDDNLAPYSTWHSTVDTAAPGRQHILDFSNNGYKDDEGTSYASPTVAAILADLWSAFPDATVAQLRDAITTTGDPCCGGKVPNGRINAMRAYNKLADKLNDDTAKPTISFVSPGTEGMSVSGRIPITFSASDNVGVVKLHVQIDHARPAVVSPSSFGALSWDTTGTTDGPHNLALTAYDAAGNNTRIERNFTVNNASPADTVKPTINFTSPADGATVSGSTPVAADITDNAGVAKALLYIDGVLKVTDIVAPYGGNWGTTAYSDGQHTIKFEAFDSSGNIAEATRTVTVNNGGTTPPPTTPPPTTPPPTTPPPTTPPPGGNPKPADINGSGKVDLTDLSILLSNWNKTTANADLNSSGKVDLTDLSMLLSKWNTSG